MVAGRDIGSRIVSGVVPIPEVKPGYGVLQEFDCVRENWQATDGSQKTAGSRSETANGLAAAATAPLSLWRRRSFDKGLNNRTELFFKRLHHPCAPESGRRGFNVRVRSFRQICVCIERN